MRASRIADRTQQLEQTVLADEAEVGPVQRPERATAGPPATLATLSCHQAQQASMDVTVDRAELVRRVPRPEVVGPPAENRVEDLDHPPDVLEPNPPAPARQPRRPARRCA